MRTTLFVIACVVLPITGAAAQSGRDCPPRQTSDDVDNAWTMAYHDYGIAVGDSRRLHGLRLNVHDAALQRVDGVNLSVVAGGGPCADAQIRGVAIGLPATGSNALVGAGVGGVVRASTVTGATVGLVTVVDRRHTGLNLGALSAYTNGNTTGASVGGIASITDGQMTGVAFAPAILSVGRSRGIVTSVGLVTADQSLAGFNLAGVALTSDDTAKWVNVGGLATLIGDQARGLSGAGLWLDATKGMTGMNLSGLVMRTEGSAKWVSVTPGVLTVGESLTGLGVGGVHLRARSSEGFLLSAFNHVDNRHTGLSIGLINDVGELHGVQIGLLNRVRTRRGISRVLPLVQFGR